MLPVFDLWNWYDNKKGRNTMQWEFMLRSPNVYGRIFGLQQTIQHKNNNNDPKQYPKHTHIKYTLKSNNRQSSRCVCVWEYWNGNFIHQSLESFLQKVVIQCLILILAARTDVNAQINFAQMTQTAKYLSSVNGGKETSDRKPLTEKCLKGCLPYMCYLKC